MNRKILNILKIVLVVIVIIFVLSPNISIYASSMPNADDLHDQANNFIDKGAGSAKIDVNKIAEIIKPLASLLLGIGTVVLVVVTSVMGIKYMSATPETRGKLKGQLIGIAVSAIVLFGAYGIWSLAYTIMSDLTK